MHQMIGKMISNNDIWIDIWNSNGWYIFDLQEKLQQKLRNRAKILWKFCKVFTHWYAIPHAQMCFETRINKLFEAPTRWQQALRETRISTWCLRALCWLLYEKSGNSDQVKQVILKQRKWNFLFWLWIIFLSLSF